MVTTISFDPPVKGVTFANLVKDGPNPSYIWQYGNPSGPEEVGDALDPNQGSYSIGIGASAPKIHYVKLTDLAIAGGVGVIKN